MRDELDRLIDEERFEEALELVEQILASGQDMDDLLSQKAWLLNRMERHA